VIRDCRLVKAEGQRGVQAGWKGCGAAGLYLALGTQMEQYHESTLRVNYFLGIIRMRREGIEKAGVAGLMWGAQELAMGAGKRKILRRRHVEKFKRPGYKTAAHPARRFYALPADWYTNSIVGRGGSPASIRRRAPRLK